jgi:hypothetical protein
VIARRRTCVLARARTLVEDLLYLLLALGLFGVAALAVRAGRGAGEDLP